MILRGSFKMQHVCCSLHMKWIENNSPEGNTVAVFVFVTNVGTNDRSEVCNGGNWCM